MFIVLLRFSTNRHLVDQHIEGHREWIERGVDEGVFLLVGTLKPHSGGAIMAHETSLPELEDRIAADPFVAADVVRPEIIEVAPTHADKRLSFLLD